MTVKLSRRGLFGSAAAAPFLFAPSAARALAAAAPQSPNSPSFPPVDFDGLALFGPDDVAELPDGLHPSAEGYRRMGERFHTVVFEGTGPFAPFVRDPAGRR